MTRKETRQKPAFSAGRNMAMKVPPDRYDETLRFYRDALGLKTLAHSDGDIGFEFSGMRLWIDKVSGITRPELWLELRCDDLEAADEYLAGIGVQRCDDVEALPEGFQGFWIRNPAGVVHLVCTDE